MPVWELAILSANYYAHPQVVFGNFIQPELLFIVARSMVEIYFAMKCFLFDLISNCETCVSTGLVCWFGCEIMQTGTINTYTLSTRT